jgi:hypothetical protein
MMRRDSLLRRAARPLAPIQQGQHSRTVAGIGLLGQLYYINLLFDVVDLDGA